MFRDIIAWENLLLATWKAAKGKRGTHPAAAFEFYLADNLLALQAELTSHAYRPGSYTHFIIYEPKRCKISAAPFPDRVVYHALCNVIEPIFDARSIPHSYAREWGKVRV